MSLFAASDDRSALISHDGRYRYTLTRPLPYPDRGDRRCIFVMLNPSTADASRDDPTIRRCIRFAQDTAHRGCRPRLLHVVNLFAYRATNPRELTQTDDPIGWDTDTHLCDIGELNENGQAVVVVAWGARPAGLPAKKWQDRIDVVRTYLGPRLWCLGVTKDGMPRHPLYVAADTPLQPWPPAA